MKNKFFTFLLFVLISVFLVSCSTESNKDELTIMPDSSDTVQTQGDDNNSENESETEDDITESKNEVQADTGTDVRNIIEKRAYEVLKSISEYDLEKLSEAIHPEKGVRFTPYGYVDGENDLVFSAEEIKNMISDNNIYKWGSYDGTGDPIELSFADYFARFVYDAGYIEAEQIGYNEILGRGNSLNNSFEFYNDPIIVEYHFPGFDPQYEGMDWKSLRLVFENYDGVWYLTGIIHDEWTI